MEIMEATVVLPKLMETRGKPSAFRGGDGKRWAVPKMRERLLYVFGTEYRRKVPFCKQDHRLCRIRVRSAFPVVLIRKDGGVEKEEQKIRFPGRFLGPLNTDSLDRISAAADPRGIEKSYRDPADGEFFG